MEEMLTVGEVAKLFKKSEYSIRYNMPDLPYVLIGGNKRYKLSDIKRYIEKNSYKGTPQKMKTVY